MIGLWFLDASRFSENCFSDELLTGQILAIGSDIATTIFNSLQIPFKFFQGEAAAPFSLADGSVPSVFRPQTGRRRWRQGTPHRRAASGIFCVAPWAGSVGEDVFVVRHGVHVVKRLADPRPGVCRWRAAGQGQRGRAAPEAEVAEDFLDHGTLVNDRDDAHRMLALWANQWIGVPDLEDDVAPLLRGKFGGRRRSAGRAQGHGSRAAGFGVVALAAHFVGIPAVVTDHLRPLVGDVLGDGGQEVGSGEDFEVAVDFGIELGAVDDGVGGGFQRHFCDGEGVAENVLGEFFEFGFVFGRDGFARVEVESGVFPGEQHLDAFGGKEFEGDEEFEEVGAEEFFERFEREWRQRMEDAVAGEEAVGDEGVEVRVEVEVFAEGVQGEDEGGLGVGEAEGGAEVFGEALVGSGAEVFEEAAVALEIGAEHFGDGQDVMTVGHGREDAGGEEGGGGLDVFLVAGGTEPAAFAGEGEEVFVAAVVAADPGEAAVEVAAVEEFVDDLGDDGAQGAEAGLVVVRVALDERGEVAVGALPQGRAARVTGAVGLHGEECPLEWRSVHLAGSKNLLARPAANHPPGLQGSGSEFLRLFTQTLPRHHQPSLLLRLQTDAGWRICSPHPEPWRARRTRALPNPVKIFLCRISARPCTQRVAPCICVPQRSGVSEMV